MALTSWSARLV